MRNAPNLKAERYRVTSGPHASNVTQDGNNGVFIVSQRDGPDLMCVVSDGSGWDHVSVTPAGSTKRCPKWEEMQFVKELFFRDDEAVIQIHPRQKDYVNNHPFCLHLWRCQDMPVPMPPVGLVGIPEPRQAEGGDGTTVAVIGLGKGDTSLLKAFADETGQDMDEAMATMVKTAIRILGAKFVPGKTVPAFDGEPTRDAYEEVAT